MKVISGKYKGRNIEGYDIDGTRPTMDRVKESLFAMIQNSIPDSIVLDLFSGSGNLGIEALSEGAKHAYLVDKNYKACSTIKRNLDTIGIKDADVLNMDFVQAMKHLYDSGVKVDVIFLDPPYKTNYIEESIASLEKYPILNENGIIVCENESLDRIVYPRTFSCVKDRKYGDKYVVILKEM
ncbi:MAG: 16S rRNA (guanine(966)-N(2))-methyltransferase RsmD [Bacilli bacterium]|nr:16S rRNA (guanine(966)-N(2))-methyltransferase RsmD [Bacilli bacterium]